ncbi:MAG: glycosyltransferase family protein, partial [Bdellovibrionota bacterium]
MKILIFSQNWFCDEFRAFGHDVRTIGLKNHLEIELPEPFLHIEEVIARFLDGWIPDIVLIHDDSAPFYVEGFSDLNIPTVYLSVDSHHHSHLHGNFGKIFDTLLIAQKDFVPEIEAMSDAPVHWMPLWASQYLEPCPIKEYGAVFVGTLNPILNPDRCAFFNELQLLTDITVKSGNWQEIFPKSEIVINQTVKKDLNFRVFEAMTSGALLLTERTDNGLFDLFEEGKHLVAYEKGNVQEAAEKIRYYLQHASEARKIAAAGRELVLSSHLPHHRAAQLLKLFQEVRCQSDKPRRYSGWLNNYFGVVTRSKADSSLLINRALRKALHTATQMVEKREHLDEIDACVLVFTCLLFDLKLFETGGKTLLCAAFPRYPEYPILALGIIRSCLNCGEVEMARDIAAMIYPESPEKMYAIAEQVVTELFQTQLSQFF